MKILIVTQYFWPESFRINDLALGLKERGHEVAVLTGKPNYPSGMFFPGYSFLSRSKELFQLVPVYRVPLIPRGKGHGWHLVLNYLSFVFFASVFGPFLCRGRYDVIFVFEPSPITVGLPAIALKWLKRAPLVLWVQDLWPESLAATGAVKSQRALDAVGYLVRFIYRRCDRILVSSRGFEARVVERGARSGQVEYYPNWAEALYRPLETTTDISEQLQIPTGFRVVFAGNIGAAQSFETILAAAEKLKGIPEIHWVILGDGHRREWLQHQVVERSLQKCVHLLGQHAPKVMPRYFSLADALLVTLRRDPIFALTVPSKIQSYLACGRPIIAALDGEGARIVQESGAGIASPAEDAGSLAEAVLELHRMSTEQRAAMGRRGRAYFEANFEREKLLDRLEVWLQELAKGKRCAS